MRNNFIQNGLRIGVSRDTEKNELTLNISSDYSKSEHKGRLYINEKRLSEEVENLWKSIKTKKLQKISVFFDEIDWYDDHTDIYTTPKVFIQRGLKKARVDHHEHGSIPKDWTFEFNARFSDTTTSTPIMEVVEKTLGSYFTPELKKKFKKVLTPVLQKKEKYCSVENEWKEYNTMNQSKFWY